MYRCAATIQLTFYIVKLYCIRNHAVGIKRCVCGCVGLFVEEKCILVEKIWSKNFRSKKHSGSKKIWVQKIKVQNNSGFKKMLGPKDFLS